ncbi:hypothetical protein KC19_2G019300 [Ceratodon purpureus]|uniref:Uncharacterized protein n=1 Tax=Ceratodon purpureus TaxID=3225 RepID=A0A8T0IR60_CERPU|nr:hypothetical protein KC19_2G019300 [Ceratodon purpureus]
MTTTKEAAESESVQITKQCATTQKRRKTKPSSPSTAPLCTNINKTCKQQPQHLQELTTQNLHRNCTPKLGSSTTNPPSSSKTPPLTPPPRSKVQSHTEPKT